MPDEEKLKIIIAKQDSEASLNWSRNSYFLVVMGILTLAYTQKPVDNLVQLTLYQILIASLGVFLSVVWLLIQYRSSQYILYYKNTARELAKSTNTPDVFPPNIGGIEMRKLVYFLPIAFIVALFVLIVLKVIFFVYPN